MALFKFNPPGQAGTKKEKAESPAPQPAKQSVSPAPAPSLVEKQPTTPTTDGAAAPHPPSAAPRESGPERAAPTYKPTVATERMLSDTPGGGKNALIATIVAMVVVTVAIGIYVYIGEKPPVAAGEISKMWVYSVHTLNKPLSGEGSSGQAVPFDQVLILAEVKLKNQSDHPIVLLDMSSTVKNSNGEIDAAAVGKNDFERAFVAYPKLKVVTGTPLIKEVVLEPGEQKQGLMLTHYTIAKDDWEKRESLRFNIVFRYQKTLTLQPPREIEVLQ